MLLFTASYSRKARICGQKDKFLMQHIVVLQMMRATENSYGIQVGIYI